MTWFNPYGIAILLLLLIPNALYARRHPEGFANHGVSRALELLEQIGRFGCFILMVFNIPGTYRGFWFDGAQTVYIAVSAALCAAYCAVWAFGFSGSDMGRALALSILPCCIFLFSGVLIVSVPLLVAAQLFAPCHIIISCKNAAARAKKPR